MRPWRFHTLRPVSLAAGMGRKQTLVASVCNGSKADVTARGALVRQEVCNFRSIRLVMRFEALNHVSRGLR